MRLGELKNGDVCYVEKLREMVVVFSNQGKDVQCIMNNKKISPLNCNLKVVQALNKNLIEDYHKEYKY